ncbi:MAG: hypothetical protein ACYSW6_04915 [Planctomycetota bacterium]|jgi:hypothetical protein
MDKTIEDDEVVYENPIDIFQNGAYVGSYVMYASAKSNGQHWLMAGVLSKLYHNDAGNLYCIEITRPRYDKVDEVLVDFLDYPNVDIIVIAENVISKISSEQSICTRLFTSRMHDLRQKSIKREKEKENGNA